MIELFHYVHCPFCVRVRMALSYLSLDFKSTVLAYDDEATPLELTGNKMLPILKLSEGRPLEESLDIIKLLDSENLLSNEFAADQELTDLLGTLGKDIHSLCMPYWIWTPEFNSQSREYFQKKKEKKRGAFYKLIQDKQAYLNGLNITLKSLEPKLSSFYLSDELTIKDLMLASHLWGMYIFPEFQFSEVIHSYLQRVKDKTKFEYHEDFWTEKK